MRQHYYDEVMSTLPDIKIDVIPNIVEQPIVQKVEHKPTKNVKKTCQEDQKKGFKKIEVEMVKITLAEDDAGTLTQEYSTMVSNSNMVNVLNLRYLGATS